VQQVRLESFTTVNISAVYNIISNIQLYGRVENLFDTEYEEVLGYNTPGLSGYAGVKFSL
jgi:vitamin B12 transporter